MASAAAALAAAMEAAELSPEEERLLIRDITVAAEALSKEGDSFFLITHKWWQNWLDYVNQESYSLCGNGAYGSHHHDVSSILPRRPTAIDNTSLIADVASEFSNVEVELHDNLVEGRDYILLPQQVWEKLHGWYGGGPTLPRKAINTGLSQMDLTIEVYPLRLQLVLNPNGEHADVRISKKDTVGELHRKACEIFELIVDQVCIWDYYSHQKHVLLDKMDKTLDDVNIQMDQQILVEVLSDANYDGGCMSSVQENGCIERESASIIVEPSRSSTTENLSTNIYTSRSCNSEFSTTPISELENLHGSNSMSMRRSPLGLIGLLNLGNTCFMNSAVQCLVHTPEFATYFRQDYRNEINLQNPFGTNGELALAFGELLRKLWSPGRVPVNPRPFKTKLARFAPQFNGCNQHDSQELLAFLLDGLHEDLNRVKKKPSVRSKDADGSEEELADDYWANHIARNDSIIVDVCQGQYKSTLVCPICGKVSVTFDPFMYLSLPLQLGSCQSMIIVVFTPDGSAPPSVVTVSVPKQGRCRDLLQALSTACALKNEEKLLLAQVHGHSIQHFLDDPLIPLSTIKADDHLIAYRFLKSEKSVVYLQVSHRREETDIGSEGTTVWQPYGIPFMTQIPHDETVTGALIHQIIHTMLTPMMRSAGARKTQESVTIENDKEQDHGSKIVEDSKLKLHLVDKSNTFIAPSEEEIIKVAPSSSSSPSSSVTVFVNWTKEDLKRLETRHLENIPEAVKHAPALKRARAEPLSLYACLDAFLREEPLVPEDMWYCPRCKDRRQASKKLDLWRLPNVLVIHLKRFSFSRSTKTKLEVFINFPIRGLDLTNYVANKTSSKRQVYELYAVINHYGSMASGHYTAHIKLLEENKWYSFDDDHVTPVGEDELTSTAAYVLFYRRVDSGSPSNR